MNKKVKFYKFNGYKLMAARYHLGYSRRALCDVVNFKFGTRLNKTTLHTWETGKCSPSVSRLLPVLHTLALDFSDVVDEVIEVNGKFLDYEEGQ